jgi:hypothetical protein
MLRHRTIRFRRTGALLGALALLVQCLVFAFHQPALAAAPSSPFLDPAAWCGPLPGSPDGAPDHGKAPLHAGLICPICQSLQAAGTGLVPPSITLALPAVTYLPASPPADEPTLLKPHCAVGNPRAPPSFL